jgi:hypothetical protein
MLPGAVQGIAVAQYNVAKTHLFANIAVNSKLCAIFDVGGFALLGE